MSSLQEPYKQEDPDLMSGKKLENLFETCRVREWPKFYKAVFHFPVSMLLLLVRLIVGVIGFLTLSLLPRTSLKRNIFKALCKVFGLVVEMDTKHFDESAKILVANHISLLDRLAINAMLPCSTITADFEISSVNSLSFWKDVDVRYFRDLTDDEIWSLQASIENSPIPLLHFPEGASTNGKIGLLKFHPGIFSLNAVVQPVIIQVSISSSFTTVSPTVLGSTAWADVFWSLILPSTYYKLKTLPSMVKLPNESAEDFSRRVQTAMASAMGIKATDHTSSDKVELSKCSQTSATIVSKSSCIPCSSKNIADAHTHSDCSEGIQRSQQQMLTMNTAAKTFGKSPKERMASYHERKALLLDAARHRYLEKHS